MCVCSAKTDNPREPIYLSKEEVGEILVRETERRRLRSSAEMPRQLSHVKPALPTYRTDTVNRTGLNYDDVSHLQQLKMCSIRDVNGCESVNIPDIRDEKSKILNCQPVVSRHNQTQITKAFESTSSNHEMHSGITTYRNSSSTMNAEDSIDNLRHGRDSGCDTSMVSTDICAVPANNDRLDTTTPAEAPRLTGGGSKTKKKKKTVTFSDNIELVASAADVLPDPIDYMSYAASIGRQAGTASDSTKNATTATSDSDAVASITADSSEEIDATDSGVMSSSSSHVRCSLCRQQWVDLTDTYCSNCTFYLSRLQMFN